MKRTITALVIFVILCLSYLGINRFWIEYHYNQDYYLLSNPVDVNYLVSQNGQWKNAAHKRQHLYHLNRLSNDDKWKYFNKLRVVELNLTPKNNLDADYQDFNYYLKKYNPQKAFAGGSFYFLVRNNQIVYIGYCKKG